MSGQIFVPWVNQLPAGDGAGAVLGFRSSDSLSAAYGIAVTGTMAITTVLALFVARYQWKWNLLPVVLIAACVFLTIDLVVLQRQPDQGRVRRLVPAGAGPGRVHRDDHLASRPRAGGARDQAGWPGAGCRSSRTFSSIRRCVCRARRCSLPPTRMPCRMRCCTTSSTTRCCTSAT